MRFFRRLICGACSPMFRHTQMMIFLKWRSSHKRGAVQHRRRVQLEMGVENTIFRPSWNDQFHILLPGHIQPWWLNHGNLPEFSRCSPRDFVTHLHFPRKGMRELGYKGDVFELFSVLDDAENSGVQRWSPKSWSKSLKWSDSLNLST